MGNHRAGRLPSTFGGANPPDERKEGVANDDYILRAYSDWYLHYCPCRFMLYDLQGKTEIAATTANSDG